MLNAASHNLIVRLKALADPARLRLLALCRQGECSVSELTSVLAQSQPRVSQQLKVLCDAGLLERFRDGQRVYYRLATTGRNAVECRRFLQLLPTDEAQFEADAGMLRDRRGVAQADPGQRAGDDDSHVRALHRAILDLTVADSVGDLLDIGCGRGRLLKLLSSRANRAVGVDIDANARDLARNEMLLAGLQNCSLRQGDMYRLPFDDNEFDTVILDDLLANADRPGDVLRETRRLLRSGGRLILLERIADTPTDELAKRLAKFCAGASLRLAPLRRIPQQQPAWLLAVARPAEQETAAA